MNQRSLINNVAEQYRNEGYDVSVAPGRDEIPESLRDQGVDLIARKGAESVAVQVKDRGQLYDLKPDEQPRLPPGWRFDLVVSPANGADDFPRNGKKTEPAYTMSLVDEVEQLLPIGALRAAILIAWSAAESAMREVARRERIETEQATPRFLLKSLYTNGLISREDFERVGEYMALRNEVVHGFPPENLTADAPRSLTDFARRLLSEEPSAEEPSAAKS